jgi:hypothetical protein
MAIPATVVRDGAMAAPIALVAMSAQGCSAATPNGLEYLDMVVVDPAAVSLDELGSVDLDNIG